MSLLGYAQALENRVAEIDEKIVYPSDNSRFNYVSFRVCGCCMDPKSFKYHRALVNGVKIWAYCILAWLILSAVLFNLKATSWPLVCPGLNATSANSSRASNTS